MVAATTVHLDGVEIGVVMIHRHVVGNTGKEIKIVIQMPKVLVRSQYGFKAIIE